MSKTGKTLITLFIAAGVAAWLLSKNRDSENTLPQTPLGVIESNVLYDASVTPADAPSTGAGGPIMGYQQDYQIQLQAGKTWMVETAVGWQDVAVALYENGKQLGKSSCAFRARCQFFVDAEKAISGTLRIRADGNNSEEPLTLEVREVANSFMTGNPSTRTGKLQPAPVSVIEHDGVYTGMQLTHNAPLDWFGTGSLQDYKIQLKAGQKIRVKATSPQTNIGVGIIGTDEIFARKFARDSNQSACILVDAPADGSYTLRVMARELKDASPIDYTLDISRSVSPEETCPEE